MAAQYSDFIDRLLLIPDALTRIFPKEVLETERVLRIREVDDSVMAGASDFQNPSMLPLLRALLLYYFDALDEATTLIRNAEGDHAAYIRAMIERRLGEIDTSRELYSRAGMHPVSNALHQAASERSSNMAKQFNWDPYMLTLMCEQYKFADNENETELVFLQRVEFEHIFDYTWRQLKVER